MEKLLGAIIFLGVIGIFVIILIITFQCIKREICPCQTILLKQNKPLLEEGEEEEDDFVPPDIPPHVPRDPPHIPVKYVNEQGDNAHYVNQLYPSDTPQTSDMSEDEVTKKFDENLPDTYMSVKSGGSRDSQSDKPGKRLKAKKDPYIDGVQVYISLLYSKKDAFLMLTLSDMNGMVKKSKGGYDYVRFSVALLPEKKYRSKTKVYPIGGVPVITLGDSFKFANVTRDSLFNAAFRLRLYGKNLLTREVCVGEIVVQLADVALRAGGFYSWRTVERKLK